MPLFPAAASPPELLKAVSYNPGVVTAVAATGAFADIDAANLAATFVVPASGRVLGRLTARLNVGANTAVAWNVREGAANVAGSDAVVGYIPTTGEGNRTTHTFVISGLTPGSTKTWKWGQVLNFNSGASSTSYGGAANVGDGPAIMEIWSA